MPSAPVRIRNPFQGHIVTSAWQQASVDVSDIHDDDFQSCLEAIDYVREEHASTSVLIYGNPGAGKTHLLRRLRRALLDGDQGGGSGRCLSFINVGMDTSANRMWRHLRQVFVKDLLKTPDSQSRTQLELLCRTRVAESREAEGDLELWWDYFVDPQNTSLLHESLFGLTDHKDLTLALSSWFQNRYRLIATQWLRGDALTEDERLKLGMTADDSEEPEHEAREVVLALCRLASPSAPIVFCFDQLEAMQRQVNDHESLFEYSQMITSLMNQTRSSLLISCVQTEFLESLKQAARGANYARLCQHRECLLEPLTLNQARRLVQARIDATVTTDQQMQSALERLKEVEAQIPNIVGDAGCTPRKLISSCAAVFDGRSTEIVPLQKNKVGDALDETFRELFEKSRTKTGKKDFDQTINHGLPQLLRIASGCSIETKGDPDQIIESSLIHPEGRIGLSICNQPSMNSLTNRLKKLKSVQSSGDYHKLVILRHPQHPLTKGAAKARQYWQELQDDGVQILHPSLEILAALEALRELLSQAQAGDLTFQQQDIPLLTVEDWIRKSLPGNLQQFLEEIASPPDLLPPFDDDLLFQDVACQLKEHCLLTLDDLAGRIERPVEQVHRLLTSRESDIGMIVGQNDGSATIIYRKVLA